MFTYEVKKSFVLPIIMVFLCGELIILKDIQYCVGGHILCTCHESDSTDECTLQSVGDDPCGFKILWIGWLFNSITREKNKVVALLSQQTANTIVLRCMIRCNTKLQ